MIVPLVSVNYWAAASLAAVSPAGVWSSTDEYEALKEKIKSGEITVDNNSDDSTKPTVSEFTTVNYIQ